MTTVDDLIDRRRLRRKVTFWRILAIAVAVLAVLLVGVAFMDKDRAHKATDHIAKVKIDGMILDDEELLGRLEEIRTSKTVKGVIVSIDSPGGTTTGGESIYEAVRAIAKEKPVTAQIGNLGASAGYMIASASDHIVARKTSIVGSIGVLAQFPNFTGLMEKVGVSFDEVKSSPLKGEPSPFNPTTEEEKAALRSLILDSYDWFKNLVKERRSLTDAEIQTLADGTVYTGRQALERKLIDALGGEKEAKDWLVTKGVSADLEIVEWKAEKRGGEFFFSTSLARALGFGSSDADIMKQIGADRLFLDGLVSVWHP